MVCCFEQNVCIILWVKKCGITMVHHSKLYNFNSFAKCMALSALMMVFLIYVTMYRRLLNNYRLYSTVKVDFNYLCFEGNIKICFEGNIKMSKLTKIGSYLKNWWKFVWWHYFNIFGMMNGCVTHRLLYTKNFKLYPTANSCIKRELTFFAEHFAIKQQYCLCVTSLYMTGHAYMANVTTLGRKLCLDNT